MEQSEIPKLTVKGHVLNAVELAMLAISNDPIAVLEANKEKTAPILTTKETYVLAAVVYELVRRSVYEDEKLESAVKNALEEAGWRKGSYHPRAFLNAFVSAFTMNVEETDDVIRHASNLASKAEKHLVKSDLIVDPFLQKIQKGIVINVGR